MAEWHAVQCQPQRELVALKGIEALDVRSWFPYRIIRRWRPGLKTIRIKQPYFPGYVFADLEDVHRRRIEDVAGVDLVLGDVPISDATMNELMARAHSDGRIIEPLLKAGDQVPLGLPGLIAEVVAIDEKRAEVLIPLFGQMRPVSLPASMVLSA